MVNASSVSPPASAQRPQWLQEKATKPAHLSRLLLRASQFAVLMAGHVQQAWLMKVQPSFLPQSLFVLAVTAHFEKP
jgi:hypothetical protein